MTDPQVKKKMKLVTCQEAVMEMIYNGKKAKPMEFYYEDGMLYCAGDTPRLYPKFFLETNYSSSAIEFNAKWVLCSWMMEIE